MTGLRLVPAAFAGTLLFASVSGLAPPGPRKSAPPEASPTPWTGRRPPQPTPSPLWSQCLHVNERDGQRLLFARWGGRPLAVDEEGGFVVAWQDETPQGSVFGVRARRFGPLEPATGEIPVDDARPVEGAEVACDGAGRFVVLWCRDGLRFRLFDASGRPEGEGLVQPRFVSARVARRADGTFLVAWLERSDGRAALRVAAFDAHGARRGEPRVIEVGVEGELGGLALTASSDPPADGGRTPRKDGGSAYAAAFSWTARPGGRGVSLLLLDGDGAPLGAPGVVSVETNRNRDEPSVAMSADGRRIVVVWTDSPLDRTGPDEVHGRLFSGDGLPVSEELELGLESRPHVAMDAFGRFVVVAESGRTSGERGVFLRRFDRDGGPREAPLRVDPGQRGTHLHPAVACNSKGDFVVAWTVVRAHPKPFFVLARRFGMEPQAAASPKVPLSSGLRGSTSPDGERGK